MRSSVIGILLHYGQKDVKNTHAEKQKHWITFKQEENIFI